MNRLLKLLTKIPLVSGHQTGGVSRTSRMTSPDWRALRAPPTEADRVLVSGTHLWLRRIPGRLHPRHLCRFYPRVANRLAQRWDDPVACRQLLVELLTDRRGGRAGFPPRVHAELHVLGQLRERQADSSWQSTLRDLRRRQYGGTRPGF